MPPPRDPSSPPSKNRRRPEVMPGGWLWLVLLILLVSAMLFFVGFGGSSEIGYSELKRLAEAGKRDKRNVIVFHVDFVGTDRLQGELQADWKSYAGGDKTDPQQDKNELDAIQKKIRGTKF